MKVLVFSNCPLDPVLGSGRTRLAWTAGLREWGHEVDIVTSDDLLGPSGGGAGRRARMGFQGWRWQRAHDLSRYDLIEYYGSEFWPGTWGLSLRGRKRRPFLVAHTDGLELLAAERMAAVPSAFPVRQSPARRLAARALRAAETLAFSRADGFVTGCELDRRYLRENGIGPRDRMEVVPLGLEPDYLDVPFHADGRDDAVAFLGSWIERKGLPQLLAVMVPLLRARPGLRLDILGTNPRLDHPLADFPPELHAQIVVHPRRTIPELVATLGRAKVFFFPSEYEGFGLALAEAMACGCAAVTTPTGFGAELRDGEEAILCPFGGAGEMRAAVERLLDDDALRAQIAHAGWRRAQGLRWETSVRTLESTYRRWLTAAGGVQTEVGMPLRGTPKLSGLIDTETKSGPNTDPGKATDG